MTVAHDRLYCVGNTADVYDVQNGMRLLYRRTDMQNPAACAVVGNDWIVADTSGNYAVYDASNGALRRMLACAEFHPQEGNFAVQNGALYITRTDMPAVVRVSLSDGACEQFALPVVFEKTVFHSLSLHKIVGDTAYFFHARVDKKNAKKSSSFYCSATMRDGTLGVQESVQSSVLLSGMKTLDERYAYNALCVYDTKTHDVLSFRMLSSDLRKKPVYSVRKCLHGFAVVTSDSIYFTENFTEVKDVITGKYVSCYCEFENVRFIGSWEGLYIDR